MSKLSMLAEVAVIGASVTAERLTNPRPTSGEAIPPSADHLTTEWLSDVLCERTPGAEVTAVFFGAATHGGTSRRTLIVEYNEAGRAAGLPTRLFCKSSATFLERLVTGLTRLATAEVGFYTELRPALEIEAPHCYWGRSDDRSRRATLLLEDVAAVRDVVWLDPRHSVIDRELAEAMTDTIATYHGAFWEDPRLPTLPWLYSAEHFQQRLDDAINFEGRTMVGVKRSKEVIPTEFWDRQNEIYPCLVKSLALHNEQPQTFLHQDVHMRNWYKTSDGRMGLFDWQCCARGVWALDLAYALSGSLTVENRRAWERDLLGRYFEKLAAAGGPSIAFDDGWLQYRQQIFHALVFWLYTIGRGPLQPDFHPVDSCLVNIERMAAMAIDLGSFDAFQ